jgi:hypothetical protein
VRPQKRTKTKKDSVGQPAKKTLKALYAEVVKLRQIILETLSRNKPPRVGRHK